MKSHQLINQTSGLVEYYTPQNIVLAARVALLGAIDLDPASSEKANETVGAYRYFTPREDGLKRLWFGNVWLNHPFGRAEEACQRGCKKRHVHHDFPYYGNAAWINKVVHEWESSRINAACCITYAATSEAWFQPLLKQPQCFLTPRTNYRLPNGKIAKGVSKGSVVSYFGPNVETFIGAFKGLGVIKVAQ